MPNKKLIIVESPTKAKTISKFLDKTYAVKSSYGHMRDLPKSKLGVDVEHDFEPQYIVSPKSKKQVAELKKLAKKSDTVILATDEDREGEAIAWHLAQILELGKFGKIKKPKNYERIVFHEITRNAILDALNHPRDIDVSLVDAQQARRVLDRLVGYELSPFLWKKIRYGLSAGRVQSVAVRLIAEREEEIKKFKPEEYWSLDVQLKNSAGQEFIVHLIKEDGKGLTKFGVKTKEEAEKIKENLEGSLYRIAEIKKKETQKNPLPPFTTSTLQQAASNRFGYSAKQTMVIAQQLYEGVELGLSGPVGLITYMRTDSLNLSQDSLKTAKDYIAGNFGKAYAVSEPRRFKNKSRGAQEAHEAIRPTDPARAPDSLKEFLEPRQLKIYTLIWQRMIASQMANALIDSTSVDVTASLPDKHYTLRATGSVIKFDGFLKVYPVKTEDIPLPELKLDDKLELLGIISEQHFTQPPPRYNEASLIKTLEELGIGRPSTYAPTLSTIQERGYVEKIEKRFHPQEIGILVNKLLVEHFPSIVDIKFTAHMEDQLDEIAENKKQWVPVIREFYGPFKDNLKQKEKEVNKKDLVEEKTDEKCPNCDSPMVIKLGRFGKFMACSNYPGCKTTKPLGEDEKLNKEYANEICQKCGKPMVVKRGRFGAFLGCSGYPDCKNIKPIIKSTGVKCPQCGTGDVIVKRTKTKRLFWGCSRYPECKYATWKKPENKSTEESTS